MPCEGREGGGASEHSGRAQHEGRAGTDGPGGADRAARRGRRQGPSDGRGVGDGARIVTEVAGHSGNQRGWHPEAIHCGEASDTSVITDRFLQLITCPTPTTHRHPGSSQRLTTRERTSLAPVRVMHSPDPPVVALERPL